MVPYWGRDSQISKDLEGCRGEISRKMEVALAGCQPLAGKQHQQCVLRICHRSETGEPRCKQRKLQETGATLYVLRELVVLWSPVMSACLEFSVESDSFNSAECPVIDVSEFSFEIVTLFVHFLYWGDVRCDGMSVQLELARMGRYYDVSLLQQLMLLKIEIKWADAGETHLSVDDFHHAGFDLADVLRDSDFSTGHLDYLKVVGFGAQDILVHCDSLPVLKRFPLLFAVDRVFGNNPNYTFVLLKNATQTTREIVDVLRRVPWDQTRLIDEASFTQRVGPDDLWQLAVSSRWEDGNSRWVLEMFDIVCRIIECKYSVQTLLDAGWDSTRFQWHVEEIRTRCYRHMEDAHVALARAGYDSRELRNLGFSVRLLERSGVLQGQET